MSDLNKRKQIKNKQKDRTGRNSRIDAAKFILRSLGVVATIVAYFLHTT